MPENLEVDEKVATFAHVNETSRDGAEVARWAHNPKVVGSNPAPATKRGSPFGGSLIFYMLDIGMCADSSVVAYLRHAGCWGMSSPGALCCARASATLAGMRSDSLDAPCAIPRQTGVCCRHACRAVSRLICRVAAMGRFLRRHMQTGRSQLLLQLSALCWGLSWRCLISPLLPRREQ